MKRRLTVALGVVSALQASCVSGYAGSNGLGPAHGSGGSAVSGGVDVNDWATSVMGATPEDFMTVRMGLTGPLRDDMPASRGLFDVVGAAMNNSAQVDIYGREELVVIHDAPPWLDPLRPVPPALTTPAVRSREPDFVFVSQTPQGLRTYARTSDTGEPTLLIMPRGTWVMGNPLVLARVAIAYARSPGPPPFLPAAPGSFEDTFVGKARPPRWVPFADQVLGGGFTFYPIREGAPAAVVFKVMYRDARTASAAAQDLRGLWQARVLPAQAERDDDDWKAFLTDIGDVRADGAMVRVESNVPPKVAAQFVNDAL